MKKYIRNIAVALVCFLVVVVLNFALPRMLPGDPIAYLTGMAEEDILRSVTSQPAKALGKEGVWGSLSVGGPADIAVLEYTDEPFRLEDKAGNVLESSKGYRCRMTVADGVVVYVD